MLKVRSETDCPVFRVGDQMVLHLPEVDTDASNAVCALALAQFLRESNSATCPKVKSPIHRGTLYCPRKHQPVVFDVETVAESHSLKPLSSGPASDRVATLNLLRNLDVFKGLSQIVLEDVASGLRLERYAPGSVLIEKGQPGRHFIILAEGAVEVVNYVDEDGVQSGRSITSPQSFGELSLLTGSLTGSCIVARCEVTVLLLPGDRFNQVLRDHPSLTHRFIRVLANQVEHANSHLIREGSFGFRGKLATMNLSTVLQVLAEARRSGRLHLTSGPQSAYVGYNHGRIYSARFRELEGASAIYALLEWEAGDFWLEPTPVPKVDEIEIGVMGLILEGMRRIDEREPKPIR